MPFPEHGSTQYNNTAFQARFRTKPKDCSMCFMFCKTYEKLKWQKSFRMEEFNSRYQVKIEQSELYAIESQVTANGGGEKQTSL